MTHRDDEATRRAKNIAAIVYMIVLIFVVGGSYIHQHRQTQTSEASTNTGQLEQ
jgi:hypothetical protein